MPIQSVFPAILLISHITRVNCETHRRSILKNKNPFLTQSYSFELPPELIATEALPDRSASRLLVIDRKQRKISHHLISELPELLSATGAEYSVVANNTRVFRARLLGKREASDGQVEFFMLRQVGPLTWQGLMRTSARVVPGFRFMIGGPASGPTDGPFVGVTGEVLHREETSAGVILTAVFSEDPISKGLGEVPLPPYISAKRTTPVDHEKELEVYNTTFASEVGSVAAPTAGRHFTPELIQRLKDQGISWNEITLHVGLGTFRPVTTEDIREHKMHAELATISPEVAKQLNEDRVQGKKILAVGTTTTRTLEGFSDAASNEKPKLTAGTRDVNLFIHPGSQHHWKMVDAMLTNFHLPESTLLMMVADFIGDLEWLLEIYQTAIDQRYRFYSYGDAMLIL